MCGCLSVVSRFEGLGGLHSMTYCETRSEALQMQRIRRGGSDTLLGLSPSGPCVILVCEPFSRFWVQMWSGTSQHYASLMSVSLLRRVNFSFNSGP